MEGGGQSRVSVHKHCNGKDYVRVDNVIYHLADSITAVSNPADREAAVSIIVEKACLCSCRQHDVRVYNYVNLESCNTCIIVWTVVYNRADSVTAVCVIVWMACNTRIMI